MKLFKYWINMLLLINVYCSVLAFSFETSCTQRISLFRFFINMHKMYSRKVHSCRRYLADIASNNTSSVVPQTTAQKNVIKSNSKSNLLIGPVNTYLRKLLNTKKSNEKPHTSIDVRQFFSNDGQNNVMLSRAARASMALGQYNPNFINETYNKRNDDKEIVDCITQQMLEFLRDFGPRGESLRELIDELNAHLLRHPDAKHSAIKEGVIRLLLQTRSQCNDIEAQEAMRETFALLGYVDPPPYGGVRILSIDGGGVRGLLAVEMLKRLEELSGKRVHDLFDLICGVSTGAIIGTLIGIKQCSLDEILATYRKMSLQIFNQSALKGTSNLVFSHSYYDTSLWETVLKDHYGTQSLISTSRIPTCPKLCAISSVVNHSKLCAYLFRNYSLPNKVQAHYMGSHSHLVWEAVRASAAAPTYFEEFKLGNMIHQDGGILFNNPTAVAVHEAKLLWPNTPIQCVVSFGTGRTVPAHLNFSNEPTTLRSSSWRSKFLTIIESATDTEGVHTMLTDLLPSHTYFRFNPYLTEMLNLDETNSEKIEQLGLDVAMYLSRNEGKFREASLALIKPKSSIQKLSSWLKRQYEVLGLIET